ncbi:hypothetical protein KRX57_00305 [Weeksellaceae bacterium TAE3-ERU29]|nr:hypothetical protein [Weeksellaceae bacterium TAE3-ERU29]
MKKIYTTLLVISALYAGQAQVRNNLIPANSSINGTTAFLDASSYIPWNNTTNEGKGFVFPRTNLVNLTTLLAPVQGLPASFPNRLDGMIVYNTESGTAAIGGTPVKRGFYYYKNDSNNLQGGIWVPLSGSEANAQAGLWKENKKVVNGNTYREAVLPMLDSEGEKRTGLYVSFESVDKTTQSNFISSGYGIESNRYGDNGAGAALVLGKARGTIENPEPVQVNDVLGNLIFRLGNNGNYDKNAGFFRNTIVEYENENSFSSEFSWGVRKAGDNSPYFGMFLSKYAALGIGEKAENERLLVRGSSPSIHDNIVTFKTAANTEAFKVDNDAQTHTQTLLIEGYGKYGSTLNIKNDSKILDTQVNRWTWFNIYDNDISSSEGLRAGLVLWAYDKANTGTASGPKMIITDNGNVGIGGVFTYKSNNIPVDEKLVVDGNIKSMRLKGTGDRVVVANENGVLKIGNTSSFSSKWVEDTSANSLSLAVTSTGAPRVSTVGDAGRNNVAIDDEGKILARGFVGYNGSSIFPDYVFEKYYEGKSAIKADYNFHNLNQVEDFIKKNGHLPGYTSAKEIAEKGLIDLGATQLTNVEKIEELYLHTIEQDKAIKAKDAKIADLEARLERIEQQLSK